MSTKLIKVGNSFNVPQKTYICNTTEERDDLKAYFGDLCLVIDDGITYILNSEGDWYPYPTGGGGGDVSSDAIAPVYDPIETAYAQNELIMYDGEPYRANQAIAAPAGDFDETKWTQVDIASTKADLIGGKVPAAQLPSYVDDVVEGYYDSGTFYEDSAHTTPLTGETGKIYVDLPSNISYRWSGSAYVSLSKVDDVRDHNGNSLVVDGIATLPEYESNIVDVQDEEGNSLVNAEKIAIVPAGGKQIEIVRTVASVDRSIYTPTELKAYVDAGRGLLYKGNVVISYSYVDDEVDGFFTAYYFVGAANFQGQKVNNDKSITTLSGLPARPMYTAESEKLANIEAGAEVNIINAVERSDGTAVVPVNKKITLPAQVVISDTEPTDTSVLWIDTSDDTVDGIDNGEEISFPQEVGE